MNYENLTIYMDKSTIKKLKGESEPAGKEIKDCAFSTLVLHLTFGASYGYIEFTWKEKLNLPPLYKQNKDYRAK